MNENKINILRNILTLAAVAIAVYFGFKLGRGTGDNLQTPTVDVKNSNGKLGYILELISEKYVDKISIDSIIEESIPTILERLDPHSSYVPAREMREVNEPLTGSFEGVGITFNMPNDTIIVVNTVVGGPSERAGVESGDRIIRINDSIVAGRKIASDSIMKLLRGKANTKVSIDVQRRGFEKEIPFIITRGKIPLKSVDVSYMINDSIGFMKMSKFARTTHREFVDNLKKLRGKGMKKLILDLRDNTGGYLDQVFKIADEFFGKNTIIVYTEGDNSPRHNYYSTGDGLCENLGIIVLINEISASASEIFAGAIQDNDRGLIVGRRSFGKGLVQEPIMFSDGSGINITIARYYTPTGRCIQKPYNKGYDDYNRDLYNRYLHNEFYQQDSIHFNDSLKYTTPQGKTVYGGGGIMPDVFVPLDTAGYSQDLFRKISQKNLLYNFILNFSDNNRETLRNINDFDVLDGFLNTQNLFDNFVKYISQNGIVVKSSDLQQARKILETQIYALIGRNTPLDDEGFYPYYQQIDETLLRAISIAENGSEK